MTGTKKITRTLALILLITSMGSHAFAQWAVGGNNFSNPSPNFKLMGSKSCHEVKFVANNLEMLSMRPVCLGGGGLTFSNAPQIVFSSTVGEVNMDLATRFVAPGGTTIDTDTITGLSTIHTERVLVGSAALQGTAHSFDVYGTAASLVPVVYAKATIVNQSNTIGIQSIAVSTQGTNVGFGYGFYGEGGRVGVYGRGSGYGYNNATYGVYAYSAGTSGVRVGVSGVSFGGTTGYGITAFADSATTKYAGYFTGNVTVTGQFSNGSDIKLKENIETFNGALDKINNLSVKSYVFKNEYSFMHFPKEKQVGLIAQDLEKVFPELVSDQVQPALENPATGEIIHPSVNYKGVNYIGLIPVTIAAVQEQQKEIKGLQESLIEIQQLKHENMQLQNELTDVKTQISEIKQVVYGNSYSEVPKAQRTGSPLSKVSISQNVPNPFNNFTEIKYVVPENSNSSIEIFNETNEMVRSVILSGSENGSIRINSAGLADGAYHYDLVVNGKTRESKRFIVAK